MPSRWSPRATQTLSAAALSGLPAAGTPGGLLLPPTLTKPDPKMRLR